MSDLTFTIEFSSNGEPVLKGVSRTAAETGTAIEQAFNKASGPLAKAETGAQGLQKAHESLSGVSRPLKAGLAEVFHQIDLEGPAAKVAAFATLHMYEGFTLLTGAALGAALGIGALVNAFQSVSSAKKQIDAAFDPKRLADTNKEVDALRERVAGLSSIGGRLQEFVAAPLQTLGDLIAKSLGFETASEKQLAATEMGRQKGIAVTVGLMTDKARAANDAVLAEMAGKPLVAIEIEKAQATREVVAALAELGIKGTAAQQVIAGIGKGFDLKALKTELEGLKGIVYDVTQSFTNLLSPLGGGPGAQISVGLNQIKQQLSDLTKQGAKFGFLDESALQRAADLAKGFGAALERQFGTEIPPEIQRTQQELQGVAEKLARQYDIKLDATQAQSALQQADAEIDQLVAKAATPIVLRVVNGTPTITMNVNAEGSPALPFSEYFESYAPDLLEKFAAKAGQVTIRSELLTPILNTLDSIANARVLSSQISSGPSTGLHPSFGESLSVRIQESERILGLLLRLGAVSGPPIERGGGGGGVGGDNNITINIGTLTRDTLDRDLLPKFESLLRKVTGKDVTFSVM